MGFISALLGKKQQSSNGKLRATQPYNSIVALEPPIKGSYPVAGNGPNVLEDVRRARARRQSMSGSIAAPPPNVPRRREDATYRPSTAPHDGTPGGGQTRTKSMKSTRGRTLSGFSMKSPPSVFSRRDSIRSQSSVDDRPPPLPPNINPPIPQAYSPPPPREIRTYVPTNGTPGVNLPTEIVPPYAQQHNRNASMASKASHMSYVDILDAHSSIKKTREASLHRTKASGMRNYGEDVADRNIADFGSKQDRDSKLDFNSPEFSYLKSVYAPRRRLGEAHSRAGSALDHVLGTDGRSGDDTQPARGQIQAKTNSMCSATSVKSGARPTSAYPPRVDSTSAAALFYDNIVRSHDDRRSAPSNSAASGRGRAMSPLSSATASISEEPPAQAHRSHQLVNSSRTLSTPPVPERGRARPITITTTTTTTSTRSTQKSNPSPIPAPGQARPASRSRQISQTRAGEPSLMTKRNSMSTINTVGPSGTSGGTRSRKGSVTYSAFPGSSEPGRSSSRPPTANTTKRPDMIVEGASQSVGLEGIIDLKNSVDTEVITKTLPAVFHEHVTPTHHEIRKEVITRDIHHDDVYHRILPVIETEILPTKHYVKSEDGKTLIEIPASIVPKHKLTGKLDQNWHISKPGPSRLADGCETASRASTDSAPDGPVVGLARGEPHSRPRGNSKASSLTSKIREPLLSSRKESITKDGIPKTEYIWRHPPVFEKTATGGTQPMYIGAGDHSGESYYSDEDEFGAARSPAKGEEELLFRDSGYGSGGMLPGLTARSPAATKSSTLPLGRVVDEPVGRVTTMTEGEATEALQRIRERRRSSAASKTHFDGLENGMRNMSVK